MDSFFHKLFFVHDFSHAFNRTANIANGIRNSKGANKKKGGQWPPFSLSVKNLFAYNHLFSDADAFEGNRIEIHSCFHACKI